MASGPTTDDLSFAERRWLGIPNANRQASWSTLLNDQTSSGNSAGPGARTTTQGPAARRPLSPAIGLLVDHGWAMVLSLGLILLGAVYWREQNPARADLFQAVGALGMIVVFAAAPVSWHLRRRNAATHNLSRKVDTLSTSIQHLSDSAALSDDARRVLNRRTERDLLCRAIEEDIQNQEWDAAIVLCNELAERFGYLQDAEEFRARIEIARHEVQERRVGDAIARLDGLIVQRRWDLAHREALRIQRLFPESPRVERLRDRVEQARSVYKQDLERRFLEAASASARTDEAMGLLKEMDAYLTEGEAEPFREVARGVIGRARDNLGAQFKLAVNNRQWAPAAALGRRIINEFPNTRMADEVRGLLDGILARANTQGGGPTPAEVSLSRN
jgi:hypothetical protein